MQYILGPVVYPAGFFDFRFAEKYGVCEAILFNGIAHEITLAERLSEKEREYNFLGTMEDGGHLWVRFTEKILYHPFPKLFDAETTKKAVEHMKDSGVILIRPSMTRGYYWVAPGDENRREEDG